MTEIVKASLENGVQKIRITADKGYHPAHIQLQKGVPAEITFHRVTPSNCYKEILFEEEGILEPIGVDEEKVIRFTPQELGQHEFSCGMKMQKGSYTVVDKTRNLYHFYSVFGLLVSYCASCDSHDWDVDRRN